MTEAMTGAVTGPVSRRLQGCVQSGQLRADAAQAAAATELDRVLAALSDPRRDGFLGLRKLIGARAWPGGLYMWGGVGRGKSMLMDWFFAAASVEAKRRVHFHAFMLEVHEAIHAERRKGGDDPIPEVAEAVVERARLLCFDEFHVTDITDAMILSRLFGAMWEAGCTVVATSNRAPDDLYRNGLNRQLFLPFIEEMKRRMRVHEIAGGPDHRLRQLTAAPVYYTPLGPATDAALDAAWDRLTGEAEGKPTTLRVQGRDLVLRDTAAGVARADFSRLCEQPLGAADYLGIAQSFQTLILEDVPVLGRADRNAAKRFVTLIDALYETRTKLVMGADAEPDALYSEGDGSFEFQRTASRLMEMRTENYLGERRKL